MSRLRAALTLGLIGVMGGCDLPGDSDTGRDGLEALQDARARARAAPYLTAVDKGRRLTQFAPGLTVISRDGTVLAWERRHVAYFLRKGRRCYERSTEFEHADALEVRRDIVVPDAFIHEAELAGSDDKREIHWRGPDAEEGYRVEGIVYLDEAGRAVRKRERAVWLSGKPRDPWLERRFTYPSSLGVEHDPPEPRCAS